MIDHGERLEAMLNHGWGLSVDDNAAMRWALDRLCEIRKVTVVLGRDSTEAIYLDGVFVRVMEDVGVNDIVDIGDSKPVIVDYVVAPVAEIQSWPRLLSDMKTRKAW